MSDSSENLAIHKLLKRQLRSGFAGQALSPQMQQLLQAISTTYHDFDSERAMSERSMQIASYELREQNERLRDQTLVTETLLQIGQTIAAELDLQKVLQRVLDESISVVRAEYGVFIYGALDGSAATSVLPVVSGSGAKPLAEALIGVDTTRILEAFGERGAVRIDDVTGECASCPLCRSWISANIPVSSYLALPVISRQGEVLGGLAFGHRDRGVFTKRDESLIRGISTQAAIAVDNARLYQATLDAGERLAHQSLHDALTGLPNRVLFRDRLERCIERRKRTEQYYFAVLFLDLDRFKTVNDSLGHAAGDKLLKAVSANLIACVRGTDSVCREGISTTVARMGGDEFTVLLDDLASPADAAAIAKRIIDVVNQPHQIAGQEIRLSASIGIAQSGPGQTNPDDLLRDADAAMYHAKSSGRARYAMFDAVIHGSVVQRLRLEADLRYALSRNELRLMYQPIMQLESRQIIGFEALLRWEHEGRIVPPGEFIPIAEDVGLIVAIGEWVLQEACIQLREWQKKYPHLAALTMSVNLSQRQLAEPGLVDHTRRTLADTGIDPRHLKLEITESMVMQEGAGTTHALRQFREMGVGIQLDDFGTGYSSLSHLHAIPLEAIKIDRSFVASVGGRRDCVAVLQAIVTLAHDLNMKVVAEGLEQPEQVALLQMLHCDLGQGFFFAKPMSAPDAEAFANQSVANTFAACGPSA